MNTQSLGKSIMRSETSARYGPVCLLTGCTPRHRTPFHYNRGAKECQETNAPRGAPEEDEIMGPAQEDVAKQRRKQTERVYIFH